MLSWLYGFPLRSHWNNVYTSVLQQFNCFSIYQFVESTQGRHVWTRLEENVPLLDSAQVMKAGPVQGSAVGKKGCPVNCQGGRKALGRNSRRAEERVCGGKCMPEDLCGPFYFFLPVLISWPSLTTVLKFPGFPVRGGQLYLSSGSETFYFPLFSVQPD